MAQKRKKAQRGRTRQRKARTKSARSAKAIGSTEKYPRLRLGTSVVTGEAASGPIIVEFPIRALRTEFLATEATVSERMIAAPPMLRAIRPFAATSRLCVIEGDSWFNYPLPFAIGIDEALRRPPFGYTFARRRFSDYGDTLENMTLGPSWQDVKSAVQESQTRVLLFSGGGNDIAGPQFVSFLHHRALSDTPVREESLRTTLEMSFEPCIRRMSQEVHDVSPQTQIFMHGYAHPLPDGRDIDLLFKRIGPWLKPSFDQKQWPFEPAKLGVARIIDLFNELLARLAGELPNFTHVDLRPVVTDQDWENELHLDNDGFARCARAIDDSVRAKFPDW
jgi:hypothetical protein